MALTEITSEDLQRLKRCRIDHFRSSFSQNLSQCSIDLDRHNTLIIDCPTPARVDKLLAQIANLCDHAWLILGAEAVALVFVQEEIHRQQYCHAYSTVSKSFP